VTLLRTTPPNGESLEQLIARARQAYDLLIREYAGKRVLLVSHGGFIRALTMITQNLSYAEAATTETHNAKTVTLTLTPQLRRI
jgi:alpha-ribazole phosphatase